MITFRYEDVVLAPFADFDRIVSWRLHAAIYIISQDVLPLPFTFIPEGIKVRSPEVDMIVMKLKERNVLRSENTGLSSLIEVVEKRVATDAKERMKKLRMWPELDRRYRVAVTADEGVLNAILLIYRRGLTFLKTVQRLQ